MAVKVRDTRHKLSLFSPTCEVILHPSSFVLQAVLSSALLAAVLAAPAAPVYGPPAPVVYPDEVPVYKYTYAVKDDYSFSNFNAHEERDGYNAAGGYQVALPDGRTQIVTYTATKVSTESQEGSLVLYCANLCRTYS